VISGGSRLLSASVVQRFNDADRMQQAIRAAHVEFAVTGRGVFDATLTRIDLAQLWLQRGTESSARIAGATVNVDRLVLLFATTPGPAVTVSGRERPFGTMSLISLGQHFFERTA